MIILFILGNSSLRKFSLTFCTVLVVGYFTTKATESIARETWSNIVQDLSLKLNDYKSNEHNEKDNGIGEGFMLLSNNRQQSSTKKHSANALLFVNRISTLNNITSSTCKTITSIENSNDTLSPTNIHADDQLHESPLSNTKDTVPRKISSPNTTTANDDPDIKNYLAVNDDDFSKQLLDVELTYDGSGDTTEETTEYTSETTTMSDIQSSIQPNEQNTTTTTSDFTAPTSGTATPITSESTTMPTAVTTEGDTNTTYTIQPTLTSAIPDSTVTLTSITETTDNETTSTGTTHTTPIGTSTTDTITAGTGTTYTATSGTGTTNTTTAGTDTSTIVTGTTDTTTGGTGTTDTTTAGTGTTDTRTGRTGTTDATTVGTGTADAATAVTGTTDSATAGTGRSTTVIGTTASSSAGTETSTTVTGTIHSTTAGTDTTDSTMIVTATTFSTTSSTTVASASISVSTTGVSTTTARPIVAISLSNSTILILRINCTSGKNDWMELYGRINSTLSGKYPYIITPADVNSVCNNSGVADVTLEFPNYYNISDTHDILSGVEGIGNNFSLPLLAVNKCGQNETILVIGVTSCFLINACNLCGLYPVRGRCEPETGLSKCRCYQNQNDSSRPYVGDFCEESRIIPINANNDPSWAPIIVGILAGLAGLFCAITCCLWFVAGYRRRRRNPDKDDVQAFRLWHLPRATIPTPVSNENNPDYMNSTMSTSSSSRTYSNPDQTNPADSTFFKELDQKMGENLRATIARPNASAMLASLPSDTISLTSSFDPIDELDSIIDNEDLNVTFHDPLNDLFEDDDILEAINPNVILPRPIVDSKPSGLFSV
ncbi:unnamed protein product [Rotaria magnacalcarata]|uniref:Uncharacterized protein n=2 Tax=Rotaria magnacalcarata TaxID=392030 RepID=A0A819JDR9_9BILA|nr:unnamed protein product [Rotaria magnacalcarata]